MIWPNQGPLHSLKNMLDLCLTCFVAEFPIYIQGSHISQMMKFKGISRVIKGWTAHFQEYFWKTVVSLLYVNWISSIFSHLFQVFLVYAAFYSIINNFP